MYSSVKFLSPIVTAGLPAPGPLAGAAPPLVDVVGVVEAVVVVFLDELPHAASATAARIATKPVIPVLSLVIWLSSWSLSNHVFYPHTASVTSGAIAAAIPSSSLSLRPRGVSPH